MTNNEQTIVNILRELKPFERVEIVADKLGKPDQFLVHRQTKVILTDKEALPVK